MPEHMSVAGAITIIVIEPVLECIVQLLMVLLCNFESTLIGFSKDSLKSLNYETHIAR